MVLVTAPAAGQLGVAGGIFSGFPEEGTSRAKQRAEVALLLKARHQRASSSHTTVPTTLASAYCPPRRSSSAGSRLLFESTLARGKLRRRRSGGDCGGDDSDSSSWDWDTYELWFGGGGNNNNNNNNNNGGSYWRSWGSYGGNDPFQQGVLECLWQLLCVAGMLRSAGFLVERLQQESASSSTDMGLPSAVPVAC